MSGIVQPRSTQAVAAVLALLGGVLCAVGGTSVAYQWAHAGLWRDPDPFEVAVFLLWLLVPLRMVATIWRLHASESMHRFVGFARVVPRLCVVFLFGVLGVLALPAVIAVPFRWLVKQESWNTVLPDWIWAVGWVMVALRVYRFPKWWLSVTGGLASLVAGTIGLFSSGDLGVNASEWVNQLPMIVCFAGGPMMMAILVERSSWRAAEGSGVPAGAGSGASGASPNPFRPPTSE